MDIRPRYLVIAAALHLLLFALLFVSAFFPRPIEQIPVMTAVLLPPPPPPPPKVQPPPPKPEPPKPEPPKPKPKPEPTPEERVADVLKKLNCETIPDLKREAAARPAAEATVLRARIADMEAKCRKKDEDKKKKEEQQKKLEEEKLKLEEEKQQKLEQERLKKEEEKKKLEEEKRQKLEDERLKKEEEKRKQDAERERKFEQEQEQREREYAETQRRKAALEAAALAESEARADAAAGAAASNWAGLVAQKVKRNWSRPPGLSPDLIARVRIVMLPSGDVTDVKIVTSSGNAVYDASVDRAVRKASPLPRLDDPRAYSKVRDIVFKFSPQDLGQ